MCDGGTSACKYFCAVYEEEYDYSPTAESDYKDFKHQWDRYIREFNECL